MANSRWFERVAGFASMLTLAVGGTAMAAAQADESTHVELRTLSTSMATRAAVAAYENCLEAGYHVAAAVVGRDGRLIAFARSPLAGPHTIEVALRKAYTANTFQTATSQLLGNEFMRDIPGTLIIGGGLPIAAGGQYYGAIAVSGAPARESPGDMDEGCAIEGRGAILEDLEMAGF